MSAYLLTCTEAWALSIFLHLPVQPGSAMAGWLSSARLGISPASLEESMAALQKKGYFDPTHAEQPFVEGFLASLSLLCMNAAEVTALIHRNGQKNLTRFAQVGEGLVQFGMDETNLTFQDVEKIDEAAGAFLPDWSTAQAAEDLRAELPLGVFLLFKQAGMLADLALVDSGFQETSFKKSRLIEQFKIDQRWVDIFHAEGVRGVLPADEMPLEDYFDQLCGWGYLEESGPDGLRIGAEGLPLAEALGDPDLCNLAVSLQAWEGGFPQTGIFLYGSGRLFLVELKTGLMIIQQLSGLEQGQAWIRKLLVKGSQARYIRYIIPPTPKPQAAQTAPAAAGLEESAPLPPVALVEEATRLKPRPWRLSFESGPLKGQRFPLGEKLTIGRALDNDLVLTDTQVSRKHTVIERKGAGYQVSDLGSGNGTLVNGVMIHQATGLKPGDALQIGETRLMVVGPAAPVATGPLPLDEATVMKPAPAAARTPTKVKEAALPTQVTPAAAQPAARCCAHCGAPLKPTSKFCGTCGKPAPAGPIGAAPLRPPPTAAPARLCPKCGEPARPGVNFCKKCGTRL